MNHFSLSIDMLQESVARGKVSARSLCESALTRIEGRDSNLGAMADVIAASALEEADVIDRAVFSRERVGKLAGIPITVKDNIDTVPATCSAGLIHLADRRPNIDASVVTLLRSAGAVILGSTKTDSGGFGVTTPDVVNPGFPDRFAGGSSGGSAAAVAAGYCKAAIGTDTGGSIRIPAACCGIVGFKPTFGRVSTAGVRPLASSVDHVGVLALSVGDIRSVMEVIDPGFALLSYKDQTRVPVIGIARTYVADASPVVAQMFAQLIGRCADLGYNLREVELPHPEDVVASHLVLSLTEAALFYSGTAPEHLDSLPAIARDSIRLGLGYKGYDYLRALRQKEKFLTQMQEIFSQVDFIALPTMPMPAPNRSSTVVRPGDVDKGILQAMIRYTAPFDQSGHPALALPWRLPNQHEIGSMQLVGASNSDRQLLALAESLERQICGLGAVPVM